MIWSFLKVVLFVGAIAALTFGSSALLDTHGGMRVLVAGYEFTLGPFQALVALLMLLVLVWLLMKAIGFVVALLRFLNGDETAISRYFDRNRERKGYQAAEEAMMAIASGEGRLALAHIVGGTGRPCRW
jgi:HemY protein